MSTRRCSTRKAQAGLTLIEVGLFIVIVGIALAGVLLVFNVTTQNSASPIIHKQMLAIAESLLEEVQMQPFTFCDPSDANATTATGAQLAGPITPCATLVQSFGKRSSQTRSPSFSFNNVPNYCNTAGNTGSISCPTVTLASPIAAASNTFFFPTGYSATITLTPENLGPTGLVITSSAPLTSDDASPMNVLRIAVMVSYQNESVTLEGYRTRYAPNYWP